MSITLNVPQYSVTEDTVYWNDLFEEHKNCRCCVSVGTAI